MSKQKTTQEVSEEQEELTIGDESQTDANIQQGGTPGPDQLSLQYVDLTNKDGEKIGSAPDMKGLTNIPVVITQREYAFLCFVRAFNTGILESIDVKNGHIEVVGTLHQRIDFSNPRTIERLFDVEPDLVVVNVNTKI